MFNDGDIVYYIGVEPELYKLDYETPYKIIKKMSYFHNNLYIIDGNKAILFNEKNLMLENDYKILKRKFIIKKIKKNRL